MDYRVAFSVSIKAPKGFSISFAKHRNFIRWLRDQGFAIKGISCDTWGGPMMQQELKSDGFEVKTVSVDRVDNKTHQQNQYAYFKTTMTDLPASGCSMCPSDNLSRPRTSSVKKSHFLYTFKRKSVIVVLK